jgi:hypothetical protein
MNRRSRPLLRSGFAIAAILAAFSGAALADSPALGRVMPRGGQRGTEIDVTLTGGQLKDAKEIFFFKPGIEVIKFEAVSDSTVKVRFKIAADAALGEYSLRLRTATGISELRTFNVGPFPSVEEKEPNNKFTEPQKIELNTTVTGTVTAEDVDYFVVDAKKGQRLTAELEGIRLGVTLFDAYVAILDKKRFELDASDDTALLLQDPVASIVVPEDGQYVIQVRETSYGGNDQCLYRLHVGTFPRPMAVFPLGGRPGEEIDLTFLGDVKGKITQKVKLPATPSDKFAVYAEEAGLTPPSPNWIRVSDLPNILEVEPNNTREQATSTEVPLPVAFNGVIEKEGDEDWFRFKAKKGDDYEVRVYARALRSPLDSTLAIFQNGTQLVANDDAGGPDSMVRFKAPADGAYELRVRDHLNKGGPDFVYRIEFNAVRPAVYTHIPAYDREPRDQVRQTVVVPRGNRYATWIRVNRAGFNGAMTLAFEGLPPGITVQADPIGADVDRTVAVFEAAPDAAIAGALIDVIAKTVDPAQKIEGGFRQDVNLVYGAPNNTIYFTTRVNKLAVAVAEEAPYTLRIVEPKAPLVQSGSMNLKVVADRKEGFDKPIELRLLWAPPGIGAATSITMPQGAKEFDYPINAKAGAATHTWRISILGESNTGNGIAWVSTPLTPLSVAPPYVAMKIEMATVEQGKATEVVCKLDQLKPFEGKAKVSLHGMPSLVTVEPAEKEITKDDKEVIFKVVTDAKSPAGQHKSLFGQIVVVENGEPVYHSVAAGGILRIDTPPPPRKDAPVAKPGDPKPADASAKRLTRLEQLRQEAEERAKEGGKQQ